MTAFANHRGGLLLIGVEDAGEVERRTRRAWRPRATSGSPSTKRSGTGSGATGSTTTLVSTASTPQSPRAHCASASCR
ncbi:MAG: ATP-binding protein [Actinobacteria bacterium]|nr:ATP-binding protein [Actinomycetota bacterium]